VVSPAHNAAIVWVSAPGDYATFNSNHTPDGTYENVLGLNLDSLDLVSEVPTISASAEEKETAPGASTDSDPLSEAKRRDVALELHLADVASEAERITRRLRLSDDLAAAVVRAAAWHDLGKAHDAFQARMGNGDGARGLLAKSTTPLMRNAPRRHFRHELASALAFLSQHDGEPESDLIAYLIAAHHGKVRIGIRALPTEKGPPEVERRFGRGVWDGDQLPPVRCGTEHSAGVELSLALMEMGEDGRGRTSWTGRTQALRAAMVLFCWRTLRRWYGWRIGGRPISSSAKRPPVAIENIPLAGCRPTPLASYLKALGVLRVVSEQSDPTAAGFWRDERFHLQTRLDKNSLRHFLLQEYAPTPIIAPWNRGSGFYPKDAKEGIEALATAEASRFASYRAAVAQAKQLIDERGLNERPSDKAKQELIAELRASAEDSMLAWIDAAVALTIDRIAFPPLLGTGGNDGRLDFTNNFMQRLAELFDVDSGSPRPTAVGLLNSALFHDASLGLAVAAIGQFSPGAAGGPNSTAGYDGPSRVNGWDFVLMLEGAVIFAGGVSRRLEGADAAYLSYPFTVRAAAAGFGTASLQEQSDSRGEIWLPLWHRPSTLGEVRMLFREGRLSVGARPARDGLDAARAVAALGADRRIAAFERYGFVKRQGLAYLAVPLGRRIVKPNPTAELASDLDRGRWLERFRREGAADAPAELRATARDLEEALFELTAMGTEASEETCASPRCTDSPRQGGSCPSRSPQAMGSAATPTALERGVGSSSICRHGRIQDCCGISMASCASALRAAPGRETRGY
jgi:CRISPR-associated endonuclease Cas3-HD